MPSLPIDSLLPDIRAALAIQYTAVIQASPGAGKTTRVPLALLDAPWLAGRKLIMLEPRRLAARSAAQYMAKLLGEPVGETVGYRVRLDTRVGPRTRVEVVTEGVLTRLLQSDPALTDYGLVIFDEFHERSLDMDLALALCLEARPALRPDLRLAVMSATLEAGPLARWLGEVPLLASTGRSFAVATRYLPPPAGQGLAVQMTHALRRVLAAEAGSVLAFLPGSGEIREVAARLAPELPQGIELMPLYGNLPQATQDAAILPSTNGRRKVVLATSIAETSLTIEGVRVVVDSGLARVPRFDPVSGMTRLATVRVSRDSADQRCGRAGRQEPGVCYRLWSEGERLEAHRKPEILEADLASLSLELAGWGAASAQALRWLDPPPAPSLSQARELLRVLEALDTDGRITIHGRRLLELPLHPRLAHMVVKGAEHGYGGLACRIAALVSERDILPASAGQTDIGLRLRMLDGESDRDQEVDRHRLRRVRASARDIARQAGIRIRDAGPTSRAGVVLAHAYPDRIARRRPGPVPRYLLSGGRGASLRDTDLLSGAPWLAVAALDGHPREARIYLAAPLSETEVREEFAAQMTHFQELNWDEAAGAVQTVSVRRLGAVTVDREPGDAPDPARVAAMLMAALRRRGLGCLPWTPALRDWQARIGFLRRLDPDGWPAVQDETLLETLEDWLAPHLAGRSRLAHLTGLPLGPALHRLLDHTHAHALVELAPTHWSAPTGSRIPIDYRSGSTPVLAVRLQELFGVAQTPCIAGGRQMLILHLLSPAHRTVQVTQDLAGFWRTSYRDVRKDMKGRYPKHPWPDDPLSAPPTRYVKPRRR